MFVVQHIEIIWTKATRAAPAANVRAALPRAFACSELDAPYVLQRVRMSEQDGFRPAQQRGARSDAVPRAHAALRIAPAGDGVYRLGLTGGASGQPRRHGVPQAIALAPGESARLSINGRHSGYWGQCYIEHVYNVASGDAIAPDRFLRAPDHVFALMADLF